jgi:phospholipase A1
MRLRTRRRMRVLLSTALLVVLTGTGPLRADDDGDAKQDAPMPPLKLTEATTLSQKPEGTKPATWWDKLRHCDDGTDRSRGWLRHFASGDRPVSPIFDTPCDVDWHEPIFILPVTYSRDYESDKTELLFAVSAKLRLLGLPAYFAYSQRSFWSVYDANGSRPFRETVYNPELFWRWTAPPVEDNAFRWGADIGYEHESNGRDLPESRSWDRIYFAPYFERGGTAAQFKLWYRLPEKRRKDPEDAEGDDNPDIVDYMGYGELHLYRRFNADQRVHMMSRFNPENGNGAIQLEYSWRIGEGDLFWTAYAFHGYGESLTDYNDSVTRIGIGFALAQ